MTIALLKDLGQTADYWGELCKRVVPDPEDIQENYDEHERSAFSPAEVQSVLTLDAVFLAGYLGNWQDDFTDRFPAIKSALARITDNQTNYQILQDLIKVENQIPLIPIENVLHVLMGEVGGDTDKFVRETMHKMCYDVVTTFSSSLPGYDPQQPKAAMDGVSFVECRNFLDCVYTVLTRKLRAKMKQIKVPADNGPEASTETSTEKSTHTPPGPESSTKKSADTPPAAVCCFMASNKKSVDNIPGLLPSVTELKKAGIEFRGRQGFDDVVFKTSCVKGTLYLPSLHIYDTTESLWRNLVAHEQQLNDGAEFGRHPDFINFIDLMDSLIDSEHDVVVLRSGKYPTIADNGLGTDAAVANLFNTLLLYTVLIPSDKWSKLRRDIYKFYNLSQRQMYLEFKDAYFGKPWLTISVVAATIVLVMTIITAAYTMALYYHP
ncbi:unnamed protein product [Calypogeia fissa]